MCTWQAGNETHKRHRPYGTHCITSTLVHSYHICPKPPSTFPNGRIMDSSKRTWSELNTINNLCTINPAGHIFHSIFYKQQPYNKNAIFVLWCWHAKRLEKRVPRSSSRTPRASRLVTRLHSSFKKTKKRKKERKKRHNFSHYCFLHKTDITLLLASHLFIFFLPSTHPHGAHRYIHSKEHFTHNLSRGTDIIINRDKE